MDKVAILTDSSCDIDDKTAEDLGIYVLRMPLTIGDKEYIEGVDIDLKGIKDKLLSGEMVHTAQVQLGALIKMYNTLLEKYDQILHIPLSSGLSGTYETALMTSKTFDNKIAVVDAKAVCYPIVKLCLDAKKLIKEGKDAFAIKAMIEAMTPTMDAVIIPEDLNYLKRGGRVTPSAAALANLLKITPILYLRDDGVIDIYDKVRTMKKAIQKGIDKVTAVTDPSEYYWMVIADGVDELAESTLKELEEITKEKVERHEFGAVILSHTGPGVLAFGKIKKLHE